MSVNGHARRVRTFRNFPRKTNGRFRSYAKRIEQFVNAERGPDLSAVET
jgi:uridine kinase